MATVKAQKIIDIALKEVGYIEKSNNVTKYGQWFGLNGTAWCGIFVSWVYDQAKLPLGKIGYLKGFAGCATAVAHYRKTGEVTDNPKPGDIVFFDWDLNGKFDHTGIFVAWKDEVSGTFHTIEGNTSTKNQSNGGQVMARIRSKSVAVFVHPKVLD